MRQPEGHRRGAHRRSSRKQPHHLIIARGDRIRSFTVRPRLILGTLLLLVTTVGAAVGTAGHFLLARSQAYEAGIAQSSLEQSYERQIADLHRQLDSVVSRGLVEQHSLDQQIADLAERQDVLNQRQQLLTGLASEAIRAGIEVLPAAAPTPVANPLRLRTGSEAAAQDIDPLTTGSAGESPGPEATLAALGGMMSVVESDQMAAVERLADAIVTHNERVAAALESIGYEPDASAVGGPFEASNPEQAFDDTVAYLSGELATFAILQATARDLPLAQPLTSVRVTSGFGRRTDPFLGRPATHTGIDLSAYSGTEVFATGAGRVTFAGSNGGYGRMVEIDHGDGLSTRFAHLSSISVRVGETVGIGTIIGRSGSTGRSTGPHLHYEVRRNGQAVDPLPFLQAGQEIVPLLQGLI